MEISRGAVAALNVALILRRDWAVAITWTGLGYRGLNNFGTGQYASGIERSKKTQERLKWFTPALADQLGGVTAGKIIQAGSQAIKRKIPLGLASKKTVGRTARPGNFACVRDVLQCIISRSFQTKGKFERRIPSSLLVQSSI